MDKIVYEETSVPFMVKLPTSLHTKLKISAISSRVTMQKMLAEALAVYLKAAEEVAEKDAAEERLLEEK